MHTQGDHDVNMKAEIGVMLLQARKCLRLPASQQKLGERRGTDSSSEPPEEISPDSILILAQEDRSLSDI